MNKLVKNFFDALMEYESQQRLSRLIKQLRGDQSQRSFAKTLGVSYAAVRSWEEAETMPAIKSLQKIATYSRQSVESLLQYLKHGEDFDVGGGEATDEQRKARFASRRGEMRHGLSGQARR